MTIRDIVVAFGFKVDKSSEKDTESRIQNLKSMATKLLGAIAIGFSLSNMNALAEEFNQVNDQINNATKGLGDQEEIQRKILVAANETKSSYGDTAKVVSNLVQENSELFASIDDAIAFNEATTKLFKTAGKGADQIAGLQEAINKSFAKGAVDTETVNQLLEQSPEAVKLLSKQLDTSSDKLLQMATDGKIALSDLRDAFVNNAEEINNNFETLDYSISDAVLNIRNQWGLFCDSLWKGAGITNGVGKSMVRAFTSFMALLKKVQPLIERIVKLLLHGVQKAFDLISRVGSVLGRLVEKLGGVENAIKLVAMAAATIWLALNVKKIIDFFKWLGSLLLRINLSITAIAIAVLALALIIDDFINFMKGNDSVIGHLFEKAGIDADAARQTVIDAWNKTKEYLLNVWEVIKEAVSINFNAIRDFISKHGDDIRSNLERAWGIIKSFLDGVWTFLSQLATTIFGDTATSVGDSTTSTKDKLLTIWKEIISTLSEIWDALYVAVSSIFNAIATAIEAVFGWIQVFWNNWGSQILSWFKMLWDSVGNIFSVFLEVVKGVANFVSAIFTGDWQRAWEAIKQIFTGIWDMIVNFITAVWETIKLLFSMALEAIKAVWEAIWNGIKSFFEMIWNGIASFLQGIWSTIISVITGAINGAYNTIVSVLTAIQNFFSNIFSSIASFVSNTFSNILSGITGTVTSIKDAIVNGFIAAIDWVKQLPSQALTWGRDIVTGIANGITDSIGKITDAVKGIADKIKSFLHFSVPDEGPLTEYESWMPDFMSGLGKGIEDHQESVLSKVRNVANSIALLTEAATSKAQTASNGMINNLSKSITQNNTFNNHYAGGDRVLQQNASRAMNKSVGDASTQLAKGLAYLR